MWRRESVGKRLVAANAEIDRLREALEQLRKADRGAAWNAGLARNTARHTIHALAFTSL